MAANIGVLGFADSDSEDELPPGWDERTTDDGRVYYVNHAERNTQWNHPRTNKIKKLEGELPEGWFKSVLPDGKVIFINEKEIKRTFTDPRLAFYVEDKGPLSNTQNKNGLPRQRHDARTTAMQILHGYDLSNQNTIITGANSGIGFETARSLAMHNAHIYMFCRDMYKAKLAAEKIRDKKSNAKIDIIYCDLSSLRSIKYAVDEFLLKKVQLNVLILNAAVQGLPFSKTEDGFETTFSINYLGHFYLTKLLCQKLIDSAPARIVAVSSESHRFVFNIENLTEDHLSPKTAKNFWWLDAYNLSKLCLILFIFELNQRLYNKNVFCNVLHPGNMISTGLINNSCLLRCLYFLVRPFTKSLEQGAATTVYCAVSSDLNGIGRSYFNNCWFATPCKLTENLDLRQKLWQLSDEMLNNACENMRL